MCLCEGRQSMWGTVALLLLAVVASCGKNGSPDPSVPRRATGEDSAPVVYVVNYPLRYFTERIAGDRVDVRFPAPPDVDPAYWRPDEETIASYQQADLILRNGAAYAKWVEYTSLPTWKVVDTSATYRDEHITIENAVTHAHGPEGGTRTVAGPLRRGWIRHSPLSRRERSRRPSLKRGRNTANSLRRGSRPWHGICGPSMRR